MVIFDDDVGTAGLLRLLWVVLVQQLWMVLLLLVLLLLLLVRLMQMGMSLLKYLWKQLRWKMLLKVDPLPLHLVVRDEEVHRLLTVAGKRFRLVFHFICG